MERSIGRDYPNVIDGRNRAAVGSRLQGFLGLVERVRLAHQRLGIELSRFDEPHEHRDVALGVDAGEIASGLLLGAVGPRARRERYGGSRRMTDAARPDPAARRTERPRLLQNLRTRRIRTALDLRREAVAADGLDDEVRAVSRRSAAAGKRAVRDTCTHLSELLHQPGAFGVRIQHCRRPQFGRERAAIRDGLNGDDLRRGHDARALNRAQADRARTKHDDVRAGLDRYAHHRHPEPCRSHARQKREFGGVVLGEDRNRLLFPRDHQLSERTQVTVDRQSVRERGHRQQRAVESRLAPVSFSVQAVVALAALRGDRHDDAVAHFDALHHRADLLDDADAAVADNRGVSSRRIDRSERRRAGEGKRGRGWRNGRERVDNRVARLRRLEPDDDLTRMDLPQGHCFDRGRLEIGVADVGPEFRPGHALVVRIGGPRRRLRVRRGAAERCRSAHDGRGAMLDQIPPRYGSF